jgi:mannosyltransferase
MIWTSDKARQFQFGRLPRAVAPMALGLVALVLRFQGLSRQSLWADEGNSYGMAVRALSEIAPAAGADIHPPLYYYLLNLWARLFGTSEAGLRSLSAVVGCLLVITTYLWARRLAGAAAGVVAGALAAISPFALYYSQEARAYILMALLVSLSTWALTEYLLGSRSRRWAAVYVLAAAGLLWSHYLGLTVLALHNLAMLVWLVRAHRAGSAEARPALRDWALMQGAVLLAFLPWLPVMLRAAGGWPPITSRQPLWFYFAETARLYTYGPAIERLSALAWVGFVPAVLGLALAPRRVRSGLLWGLVAVAVVWPAFSLWGLSLFRPLYRAKFLLLGLSAYHVLAGAGTAWLASWVARRLGRPAGLAAALLALAPLGLAAYAGLSAYYGGQGAVRDDYRSLAAYIEASAGPDDAVILNAPGQIEVFSYYYRGTASLYPLPTDRPPDPSELEAQLQEIARQHRRVFSVLWATNESDPAGVMERWLDLNTHKSLDVWYGNVRLTEHEAPTHLRLQQANTIFGDRVALEAYALAQEGVLPGTAVPVELHWRFMQPEMDSVMVFIQVLDARSNLVGQRDTLPLSGRLPLEEWTPGKTVVDRQAVPILLGTPPGTYTLVAGLYDAATGARLLLPDGSDHLVLGQVQVLPLARPLDAGALRMAWRQQVGLGPLRLLGWDLAPLGGEPAREVTVSPGQPLSVVAFWRVQERVQEHLEFVLEGPGGSRVVAEGEALSESLPLGKWEVGQTYRDPRIIFLPGDLSPGTYILSMRVAAGEGHGQVDLGWVTVR